MFQFYCLFLDNNFPNGKLSQLKDSGSPSMQLAKKKWILGIKSQI